MEKWVEQTIKNLQSHNFGAYYAKDKNELLNLITHFLLDQHTIGCGDSITLEQLEVYEYLRKHYNFLDKYQSTITKDEKRQIYLQNFSCDTFFSSVNAISEDGKLFFIDGNGSRVAPIIYGPDQVILITGTNKIVLNEAAAKHRVREVAAPLDAKRLHKQTPCAKNGKCVDCSSKERICNDFVMITSQFQKERIKIIIVEGEYGY